MHNPPDERRTVIRIHIFFKGRAELAARLMPLVISTNPKIKGLICVGIKRIKGNSFKIEINDEKSIKVPPSFNIVNEDSDMASVIMDETSFFSRERED